MDLESLREHIDGRLDKLEDKLDNHLERISKAEVAIQWIQGHIKIGTSLLLTSLAGLAAALYQTLLK